MTKIVYAGVFEGLDRINRGWRILRYLQQHTDQLMAVGSGRAFAAVEEEFENCFYLISPPRYLRGRDRDNFMWEKNRVLGSRLEHFRPDLMILDGQTFAAQLATKQRIPIISIDQLHFFARTRLDIPIPPAQLDKYLQQKTAVKKRGYQAAHYLLPIFFQPEVTAERTSLAPPLLREGVEEVTPSAGDAFVAFGWHGIQDDVHVFEALS